MQQMDYAKNHLVGHSFGAWISMLVSNHGFEPDTMTLISPHVDFSDFSDLKLPGCPCSIIVGDNDAYCTQSSLSKWLDKLGSKDSQLRLVILDATDHFYSGQDAKLSKELDKIF